MNITDVGHLSDDGDQGEDKLEKGARRDGMSARDVAKKYEAEFLQELTQLHIDHFDAMPRATDHIAEQINLVQQLTAKGYTYEVPGDGIYMDSSKIPDYGKLMGPNYKKRLENLNAGERVDIGGKKNPTDFALWKFSPPGENRHMQRDFPPYGMGFPGWHIECSAMSAKHLGKQFDIHHGGADHITVHHTNEIAQSEACYDIQPPEKRVKYWIHHEFLKVDGGKMGKSLGNAYTLPDITQKGYSPLDLRYFYFMAQYTSFQNFTRTALDQAKKSRENLQKKIQKSLQNPSTDENSTFSEQVTAAFLDCFNTPKVLSLIGEKKVFSQSELEYLRFLEDHVLKIDIFTENKKSDTSTEEIPPEITELAHQRLIAKQEKNYALADELREKIQTEGYLITDVTGGFEISRS
jgi:cysteinyl-tRNA synthetase